jgi:hypothetical protein
VEQTWFVEGCTRLVAVVVLFKTKQK